MRKFLNHWLLLGVLSIAAMSCNNSDNGTPVVVVPKVHAASFTTSLGTPTPSMQTVTVTNTTTNGKSYSWTFGDGTPAVVTTSTAAATHDYTASGTYTITLTSTAADGAAPATSIATKPVTIALADCPAVPLVNAASFTAPDPVVGSGDITVTNTSENGMSYSWDFGDGSAAVVTTSKAAYTYTYAANGTYTITLTSTAANCSAPATATATKDVTISGLDVVGGGGYNVIVGGDMETDNAWTIINNPGGAGSEGLTTYEFGVTGGPTDGVGGSFHVYDDGVANAAQEAVLIYQEITISADSVGVYHFSADVKFPGEEAADDTKPYHYWYELYFGPDLPAEGDGYNHSTTIAGFNGWVGGDKAPVDGPLGYQTDPSTKLPGLDNGSFSVSEAGTYYFVLKTGTYAGWLGTEGIYIDNISIVRTGDLPL